MHFVEEKELFFLTSKERHSAPIDSIPFLDFQD